MGSLITANIKSRPTRTVISIAAIGLGVMLMLIIGGITSGTLNDYLNRTMGVGADYILQGSQASVLFAFSSADLPIGLSRNVLQIPGVSVAAPVLAKFSSSDFGLVFGVDLDSYNQLPGRLQIVQGRSSVNGDEVIIDDLYAKAHNLKPGMSLTVLKHQFTVSGICRSGAMVRIFTSLKKLQELNGTPEKATILFIKAAPGADIEKVYQSLSRTYAGYSLLRTSDPSFLLADTRLPLLKEFRYAIILVSMLLSFMVILLAMYTTIFERTREIGILKSLGASRRFIITLILRESVMISCLGAMFGTAASAIIKVFLVAAFPTIQVSMTAGDISRGCLLGLLGGILGALYPAYKAARMDPVKALSYE